MRSTWSGSISFGLVNIPVKLYKATEESTLDFDYLHKKDLAPIRYARVCTIEGVEVPFQEIVRGFEYTKDNYVIMLDEDFKKADVRKTKAIEIVGFVNEDEIDAVYFEQPYYLEPDKGSGKAYVLLREALKRSKKVAIAKFVLRTREHLAVIKPYANVILLDEMRFQSQIRKPEGLKIAETELDAREIDIAIALIDQLTVDFEPEQYRDTYREELEKIIEEKAKGKALVPKGEEPRPTKVTDLVSVLKESLEREKERAQAKKAS